MSRRVVFVAVVVLATALALSAQSPTQAPQQPAEAQPQRPTFRTEANFIRVDAYPTKDGVPVRDLSAADFEIREDGVLQKVETFEYVQVRGSVPQEERVEPNTIGQSRDALRNPRARVFVLFLDVPHVRIHGSWNIREPLIRLIDRVLGPEDLVGVMTPTMSAKDVVFARKTDVLAGGLRDRWPWGERFTIVETEDDFEYRACYPWPELQDVVAELRARRKERVTLEALRELVLWLRGEREERKAILTITEGWWLYRPNEDLTRPRPLETGGTEPIPGPEPVGVGPDGRLRVGSYGSNISRKSDCDSERVALSMIDNDRFFRDLMDDANRANASFYTVDPRGLAAFDAPIGPAPPPPVNVDQDNLKRRLETLQVLASNTDGLSVINSNDLDRGLRRISDDLSSYYLLGYYATNSKLDGRFRRIDVKVKRPGVDVRARRGYRAATREEVEAARVAAAAPVPESVTVARRALDSLARIRPGAPFRTRAAARGGENPTVWVTGELAKTASAAATAEITVQSGGGTTSARAEIAPGSRGFVSSIRLPQVGESVDVRVRLSGGDGGPMTDGISVDASPGLPQPVLFRRGPTTGNRIEPAAEPVFHRSERLRLEFAAAPGTALREGRVIDRGGTATQVPVTLSERTDDAGQRWLLAEVVLAPLGAGDYIVEVTATSEAGAQQMLTAFRVTR